MLTDSIIKQIESLGYTVMLNHWCPLDALVEIHAINNTDTHVSTVHFNSEAEFGDAAYRAACELARMVGIELEDG